MSFTNRTEDAPHRGMHIMRVSGELEFNDRKEFALLLQDMLKSEQPHLVIDFTKTMRLSSVFIGTLVDFGGKVSAEKRSLSVMMKDRMARVCRDAGLEKVLKVIPVQE